MSAAMAVPKNAGARRRNATTVRPSARVVIRDRIWLTVDSAISRVSAISGPVKRSRRSAEIASTRSPLSGSGDA